MIGIFISRVIWIETGDDFYTRHSLFSTCLIKNGWEKVFYWGPQPNKPAMNITRGLMAEMTICLSELCDSKEVLTADRKKTRNHVLI